MTEEMNLRAEEQEEMREVNQENIQEETQNEDNLNMEHVKKALGAYVSDKLNLTDDEIEVRVQEVLRLTCMSCAAVRKIEQDAELECEIELEDMGSNPARLYAMLSREIGVFDRYVKVHGDENAPLKMAHQDQLETVRALLCGMKQTADGELTQEGMKTLIRELAVINAFYRCLTADMTGRLKEGEEAQLDDEVFEQALSVASVLNIYERDDLIDGYEDLKETGGDMKEKIALRTCVINRLYNAGEIAVQAEEPSFEMSPTTKKILLGAGAVGAAVLAIFGPGSVVTKACAGLAAVALGACALSQME